MYVFIKFFYNLKHILEIFTLILALYFISDCCVHINYHAIFLFFLLLSLERFFFQFFFDDYDKKSEEDIYFLGYHDSFFHLTSSCMSLFRSSMYFDIMWMIYFFFLNIRIRAHFSLSISYFGII